MRFEAEKRETYLQGVDQLHRCWTSLKGGVARSNHTRRDTIEIHVPWCTCNLMSFCQVSHVYAFSCLFPWLLDAWHNISCLKGCCLECIKSPTWMIDSSSSGLRQGYMYLFSFLLGIFLTYSILDNQDKTRNVCQFKLQFRPVGSIYV